MFVQEMPNLTEFGATEYMDGALTLPVLNELFLRGAPSRGRGRPSRGRALINDTEEEDRDRRRECLELEAIDFTGCVSGVFVNALSEFVVTHLLPAESTEQTGDNNADRFARMAMEEPLVFPGLQRLGLRGVKSALPEILTPFVMAFPSLTHLDLSGTRASPQLLQALGGSSTVRLKSLALARCVRLSSESIRSFLVDSPVCADLRELNLYGDMTFVSPLNEEDLAIIVSRAPCFLNGNLVYLDLSSAPLTRAILDACQPLSNLRSLGLSYIPELSTKAIASFILAKARNVEVLTLVNTSRELDCGLRPDLAVNVATRGSVRQSCFALHSDIINPLCVPLFSFSLTSNKIQPPPTNLRVIELSTILLGGLGAGADSWKIIKSKGGRGWYVDTAAGWVAGVEDGRSILRRDLELDHPLRIELNKLSDANGNVSSGIGWHARKMEVGFKVFISNIKY